MERILPIFLNKPRLFILMIIKQFAKCKPFFIIYNIKNINGLLRIAATPHHPPHGLPLLPKHLLHHRQLHPTMWSLHWRWGRSRWWKLTTGKLVCQSRWRKPTTFRKECRWRGRRSQTFRRSSSGEFPIKLANPLYSLSINCSRTRSEQWFPTRLSRSRWK